MSQPRRLLSAGRKATVTIIAAVVLIAGLLMLVLPGPGILVTLAGLALLATEYEWAKQWLDQVKGRFKHVLNRSDPK